jgi:hypothetical protein
VVSRIRLAQADIVGQGGLAATRPALANTGMSIADDFGFTSGVHSPFKEEPARRMALQVLNTAFGVTDKGEYSGPLLQRATTAKVRDARHHTYTRHTYTRHTYTRHTYPRHTYTRHTYTRTSCSPAPVRFNFLMIRAVDHQSECDTRSVRPLALRRPPVCGH